MRLTQPEKNEIKNLKQGECYSCKRFSVYLFEDGEYVVCINENGVCYYYDNCFPWTLARATMDMVYDNERKPQSGKLDGRLESSNQVILFLQKL